ncbi:MAG: glycosyltransferase [Alphaproteobacteria bacterium]|nr:MAG: glycosyltransferase [Alphaproteobacteria bacterium]
MSRTRVSFFGLSFDPLNAKDAASAMAARGSQLKPLVYVATVNVERMLRRDRKPELRGLHKNAWLNLCDSRILATLARYSGLTLPAASRADIVERLFIQYIKRDDRVLVIGGSATLASAMRERFNLNDLRWFDAPHNLSADPKARAQCVDFIRNNPAPFVFLALGSPQQELIAHEAMMAGGSVGVAICCGTALKSIAGSTKPSNGFARLHRLIFAPVRRWATH